MRASRVSIVTALFAAACSEVPAPEPFAGTYALHAIDGRPMPALAYEGLDTDPGDGEYRIFVAAETLRFDAAGGYARWASVFTVRPQLRDTSYRNGYIEGTYTLAGDSVTTFVVGGAKATGRVKDGELVLREVLWGLESSLLQYRRIP